MSGNNWILINIEMCDGGELVALLRTKYPVDRSNIILLVMTTGVFVVTIEVAMRGFKYKEHKGIVKVASSVDQRVGLSSTVLLYVGVRSTRCGIKNRAH